MRARIVFFSIVGLLLIVQFELWTGRNGILEYINLKREISEAQARNTRLSERNRLLLEDVIDIKSRDDAIEELARNRLGMIRDGEIFYRVVAPSGDSR